MNTLTLHLSHLDHNYNCIREKINSNTLLVGVVKAEGYGSSSVLFAKRLVDLGVDYLAVAYTEEGKELRNQGITIPIMVFYPLENSLEALIDSCLEPCLYSQTILEGFKKILLQKKITQYPIHIKYNTGLNRLGFHPNQSDWVIHQMENDCFQLESVYSHLAASEAKRPSLLCDKQVALFETIKTKHSAASSPSPKFHLLNSSGVFNYPECQYDMVRCGIALHGFANHPEWDKLLKPVGVLESTITQIHSVKKGDFVGYDHGWNAPQDTQIATLPLGHADGIGRHFGQHHGYVIINGQKAPIVGNVCMDLLMVDVGSISCKEGDQVVFFNQSQNASTFAKQGNSISYELLTGLGTRIKRVVRA